MRNAFFSTVALALLALGSSTAFAQSQSTSPAATGAATSDPTSAQSTQSSAARPSAMTRDKLRKVLVDAGFQDVKVVDTAFLIQARTEDGNRVVMMINPPNFAAPSDAAAGASTTGSTGTSSGSDASGAKK